MQKADGDYGAGAVGHGPIGIDRRKDDDAANKEDQHELERGQLRAGAPLQNTHDDQQNEIADNGADDGVHGNQGSTSTLVSIGCLPGT